eukprot:g2540.t2
MASGEKEVPKEKSKEEVKREWMAKVQEKGDTLRSAPKELQNDKEAWVERYGAGSSELSDARAREFGLKRTLGRVRPPARDHHGAATLEDQIFIYGGRCSEKREKTSVLADVWSYSLTTLRWTLHEPVGSAPAARFMPGVSDVIYKGRPHLAIFAGETLPGSTKRTTLNDVWVFDPKEAPWSELFASTCSEEPGLEAGELAGPNVQALLCLATGFGFVFTLFMLMRTFGRRAQAKEMQAPLLE